MRTTLGVACAAALAGVLGACAALSGLNTYASGDCAQGCDGGFEGNGPSADGGGLAVDTAMDADAAVFVDAEIARATGADGAGGGPDGVAAVMDAESDAVASDVTFDAETDSGSDAGSELDAAPDDAASDAEADAGSEAGPEAGVDANDGGDLGVGLVAFYRFDETSGTTAADSSGNGRTATVVGSATFSTGLQGNAVTLNGTNQYVSLPSGIVSGLTSFSICSWVDLKSAATHTHIFDFGTGSTTYMFLTPHSGSTTLQFAISTSAVAGEETIDAPVLPTGSWQHACVGSTGTTATLYVDGAQVAQNTSVTLNPASLGTTTQNWLGRSQFASDPYLDGQIDNFRIYDRALSATEVQVLYAGHL